MSKKPVLVIMAAGMGSRYGGLKQIDPIDPQGHIIMDYSIHDALEAGFNKVVFIIRKDLEEEFRRVIGERIEKITEVEYVFQELDDLPEGFTKPAARTTGAARQNRVMHRLFSRCLMSLDDVGFDGVRGQFDNRSLLAGASLEQFGRRRSES